MKRHLEQVSFFVYLRATFTEDSQLYIGSSEGTGNESFSNQVIGNNTEE